MANMQIEHVIPIATKHHYRNTKIIKLRQTMEDFICPLYTYGKSLLYYIAGNGLETPLNKQKIFRPRRLFPDTHEPEATSLITLLEISTFNSLIRVVYGLVF